MGIPSSSIIEGYRQATGPRSTHARIFDVIGSEGRFYEHGRSFSENLFKFTVKLPDRWPIHFSVHVLETTGMADRTPTIIRRMREAIEADDKLLRDYYAFQGQGYY